MAKRKLTRRQAWRAEKIQAERLARSEKKVAKEKRDVLLRRGMSSERREGQGCCPIFLLSCQE